MKKQVTNKNGSEFVTQEQLDKRLLVTEGRIDEKLEKMEGRFDEKLESMEDRFDNKLGDYTQSIIQDISDLFNDKIDKIAIVQDKILAKLETWEQENAAGTHQLHLLRVSVKDHEKRIKRLESAKN